MFSTFQPTPRKLLHKKRVDLIVEEIKRWIIAGDLRPGDRLPQEAELEKLLDSSRGTVREALKVLEAQGLINIVRGPKGGARISFVSYEKTSSAIRNFLFFQSLTWADVYRVREMLEPAMAVSVVDALTPDDISALRHTVEVCRSGVAGEVDPRTHRIAELEFHAVLARACPNPLLGLMSCFISDILRDLAIADPHRIIPPRDSSFALEAIRFHGSLIDAFEAKDSDRVRALMSEHVHCGGRIVAQREEEIDQGKLLIGQQVDPAQFWELFGRIGSTTDPKSTPPTCEVST